MNASCTHLIRHYVSDSIEISGPEEMCFCSIQQTIHLASASMTTTYEYI